jgi:nucleoside-diphosphate-sugar epimerase
MFSPEPGSFNIANGCATTIRSVIEDLADRCGGRALLRLGAIEPPPGEATVLVADMTKVRARLGWRAPTSLDAGLAQILAQR